MNLQFSLLRDSIRGRRLSIFRFFCNNFFIDKCSGGHNFLYCNTECVYPRRRVIYLLYILRRVRKVLECVASERKSVLKKEFKCKRISRIFINRKNRVKKKFIIFIFVIFADRNRLHKILYNESNVGIIVFDRLFRTFPK